MTIKTTGKEFNTFYNDPAIWTQSDSHNTTWHEDEVITIDGLEVMDYCDIPEAALVTISGGVVTNPVGGGEVSLEGYFKRWKKTQTHVSISVTVAKGKLEAVKKAIRGAGGVVN